MRFSRLVVLAVFVAPFIARAQTPVDTLSLTGRSIIAIGFGLTGTHDVTVSPHGAGAHASGEIGSLSFTHWVRPELAAEISTAVIGADATVGFGGSRSNVITPILFGLSFSPSALALSKSIRPYVSAAAGPYIHSAASVGGAGIGAFTETAAGARLAAGANWFVSSHFLLVVGGDYHAVGRFEQTDTATEHASGFGMSLGLGVSWGGR